MIRFPKKNTNKKTKQNQKKKKWGRDNFRTYKTKESEHEDFIYTILESQSPTNTNAKTIIIKKILKKHEIKLII